MPRALLLTSLPTPAADETAALVPAAFRDRGWHVFSACIDSLELGRDGVRVRTASGEMLLADCDLLWVLGFGREQTFLDKMQLLATAPHTVWCVNRVSALLLRHAKYPIRGAGDDFPQPETHASCEPDRLVETARAGGGRWVLKPPAGSFGRGVHLVDAESAELASAARALTTSGRYALLQRYCPEVAQGEHRVLVAGGGIIGSYARVNDADHGPGNLAAGARAVAAAPDTRRDALAVGAARTLAAHGVGFAGLDIAGDWILEANIINPGGLATLATLGDTGAPRRLVDALIQARQAASG